MDEWTVVLDAFWLTMAWICTLGLLYGLALVIDHLLPTGTEEGTPEAGPSDAAMPVSKTAPHDSFALAPRLDR